MRKFKFFAMIAVVAALFVSCGESGKDVKDSAPAPEPQKEVYKPVSQSVVIDLATAKRYDYRTAPKDVPAKEVKVTYNQKRPYAEPIVITYTYDNGDTYVYTIPKDFGLWKNSAGKFRVITDQNNTVWLQGQSKKGKPHEFVFFGDPKYNNTKVKPNSYRGEIRYR